MRSLRQAPSYADRADAGRRLARLVVGRATARPLILGLPRGGVPVAFEVARALGAELDVLVVRKLGVPGHEELAMGAIATGGVRVENPEIVRALRLPPHVLDAVEARERRVLEARERAWRGDRPPFDLRGRDVVLVDDGIATGATVRAAVQATRAAGAKRVIVAAPVAPATLRPLGEDELILDAQPDDFYAVGQFYRDFSQTTDHDVARLLEEARTWTAAPA